MASKHVLLVYSHARQTLVDQKIFTDSRRATTAYEKAEAEHRGDDTFEIVLVGADSIETIMQTHGHYFRLSDDSLFSEFLLPGANPLF